MVNKVIVIGLGNPVLGDDGVGWRVAELVRAWVDPPDSGRVEGTGIDVDCLAGGGLSVMERLVGYDQAVMVDAINLGSAPVGSVQVVRLVDLPNPFAGHLGSAHETHLRMALELGRSLGAHLPEQVMVVAIESPYVYDFSEELTPLIEAAVPEAVEAVLKLLKIK
jgi:hydrogenase maturation protease